MLNKDVVYLWAACAQCTCGRLPAPHPAEARRLGIRPDDVTSCGECGERVMDWLSDPEVDAFVEAIEDRVDRCVGCSQALAHDLDAATPSDDGLEALCDACAASIPVLDQVQTVPEGGMVLPFRRRRANS